MKEDSTSYGFEQLFASAVANTIAIPLTYFFAYNFGHALNKKLQLFSRPRIYRVGFIGMMTSIKQINFY